MSSLPDSKFEIRVQMDKNRPWADLPQGIVGLVIEKLQFRDQLRVIAVCKNWRSCKDFVMRSECFPWVISHCRTSRKRSKRYSFTCELFDPYELRVKEVSNSVGSCYNPDSQLYAFASKDGWVLLGGEYSLLFLYNPFTNQIIHTDLEVSDYNIQATIEGSPSSPGCKIFTATVRSDTYLYLNTYCLSGESPESKIMSNEAYGGDYEYVSQDDPFYSVLYMKGKLYCLFYAGRLCSFSVEDCDWKLLTKGFGIRSHIHMRDGWLMEIDEKIVLVCMDICRNYEWMVFRFDWNEMAWVVETDLKSRAFFISGRVAWWAPLTNRHGEKVEACKVFYHSEFIDVARGRGFKCYTLTLEAGTNEAGQAVTKFRSKQKMDRWYGWISRPSRHDVCFVQPPYPTCID